MPIGDVGWRGFFREIQHIPFQCLKDVWLIRLDGLLAVFPFRLYFSRILLESDALRACGGIFEVLFLGGEPSLIRSVHYVTTEETMDRAAFEVMGRGISMEDGIPLRPDTWWRERLRQLEGSVRVVHKWKLVPA